MAFLAIIQRDLQLTLKQGTDVVTVLLFYIIVIALFPLGISPDPQVLSQLAGCIVWIGALLSAMLSFDRLFQSDYDDGCLELFILSPVAMELVVLAKCVVHWLTTGLPILIISPVLGLILNMHSDAYISLLLSMILGTPTLSLIGALGASLILGARRAGTLISLLILPLTVPILIFGINAVEQAANGGDNESHLMILGAFLLISTALCPWATASALRQSVD